VKIRQMLLLCSAAALPQLASADLAVTNPAGLGQVRAFLDFCITSDPQDAGSFKSQWQSIVGGQSRLLTEIERDPAYKQQYAGLTGELQKLPQGETVAICAVSAAAWNGSGGRDHGDHGKDDHDPKPNKGSDPAHKSGQSDR
jgi:hypothetical protein